jgi:hypothetical protein
MSLFQSRLNNVSPDIKTALLDIVERLNIDSNLMVSHPDYGRSRKRLTESPESRLNCIIEQFNNVRIDLSCPYLNSQAEDIY